jgi:hypothetical protein
VQVLADVEMQQKRIATEQELKAKEVQQDIRQQQTIVSDASEQLLEMQRRLKLLEETVEEQGKSLREAMEEGLREHSNELSKNKHMHEMHARDIKKRQDDTDTEQLATTRKVVEAEEQVHALVLSCKQLEQVSRVSLEEKKGQGDIMMAIVLKSERDNIIPMLQTMVQVQEKAESAERNQAQLNQDFQVRNSKSDTAFEYILCRFTIFGFVTLQSRLGSTVRAIEIVAQVANSASAVASASNSSSTIKKSTKKASSTKKSAAPLAAKRSTRR